MKCKFCGCTESKPCRIPVDIDGHITDAKTGIFAACGWLIEGVVCTAPRCVELAYAEAELLADQIQFFLERSA